MTIKPCLTTVSWISCMWCMGGIAVLMTLAPDSPFNGYNSRQASARESSTNLASTSSCPWSLSGLYALLYSPCSFSAQSSSGLPCSQLASGLCSPLRTLPCRSYSRILWSLGKGTGHTSSSCCPSHSSCMNPFFRPRLPERSIKWESQLVLGKSLYFGILPSAG
jgi:hypothetical protein